MSDQPYRNPKIIYKGIIRCMVLAYKKGKLDALLESQDLNPKAMYVENANKDMLEEYLRIDGNIREALETENDMALYKEKTPKFFPQDF